MVIAFVIAVVVLLVVMAAEKLHAQRVARVSRLAFGPVGRPARWAQAAPVLRCMAAGLVAWGSAALAQYDPVRAFEKPKREASKQLLICMDVSPSMQLKDSGPDPEKVSRAMWSGKVVQGILDRLDTETTRVTLYAFYTKALPVVVETFDKEVVRNALDGLPMYVAFEPGPTDMHLGVTKTLEHARVWPRDSAMLVVVSDGDSSALASSIRVPDSIADTVVIGVGDPYRSTVINGHSSRQDTDTLKQLAARLGGVYHDGNSKHLPTSVLNKLSVMDPRESTVIGIREAALVAVGLGGSTLALLGPALIMFGRVGAYGRSRAVVSKRADRAEKATRTGAPVRAVEVQA